MPYIKIDYYVDEPDSVWVKISPEQAAAREEWDDMFDVINSRAEVSHEYNEPVDILPIDGSVDWDISDEPASPQVVSDADDDAWRRKK